MVDQVGSSMSSQVHIWQNYATLYAVDIRKQMRVSETGVHIRHTRHNSWYK